MSEFKFPTEVVELPSKGFFYSSDHPLKSGKVEMKYMTAKEEDLLTNINLIKEGKVIDKVLESLIISPKFNQQDLLAGDKNALLLAIRILGYGANYVVNDGDGPIEVDLSQLQEINNDFTNLEEGKNNFAFTLPQSGNKVTFKLLTGKDEEDISKEIEGLKKITENPGELSTRLKYIITSVEGKSDKESIRDFVDNYLLASDSRALRAQYKNTMPDVDLSYRGKDGRFRTIPIGLDFFWPDFTDSI